MVNHPSKVIQVHHMQVTQANISTQAVEHSMGDLLLTVVLPLFLDVITGFGDPLSQETLLIHHFLTLLDFWHGFELSNHSLDP
jgi:hypothetical protein